MTWSRVKARSDVHGVAHMRARRRYAARHHPLDPCARCGHPLGPMGPGLHLDHDDHDKRVYIGFSHGAPCPTCGIPCNLRAAGQLGRERQQAQRLGPSPLTW